MKTCYINPSSSASSHPCLRTPSLFCIAMASASASTTNIICYCGANQKALNDDNTPTPISQSSPTHHGDNLSTLRSRSVMRASRPTVKECLHTPDEEMYDLTLDVYNMFFLSDIGSQGFFYSIAVLFTKVSLYVALLVDLRDNKKFPFEQNVDASDVVSGTLN